MTDSTNRKLDVDSIDEDRISRDDPLFELSQIIGYSEPHDLRDEKAADPGGQIDLEDALLRELEDFSSPIDDLPVAEVEDAVAAAEQAAGEPEFLQAEPQRPVAPEPEPEQPAHQEFSAPDTLDRDGDDIPDTLEAELMDLLGGLGDKAGAEWAPSTPAPPEAERFEAPRSQVEFSPRAETLPQFEPSPQVPAAAPMWFNQETRTEQAPTQPAAEEDTHLLDAFEDALSEGLALTFDEEAATAAEPPVREEAVEPDPIPALEFELDLDMDEGSGAEDEGAPAPEYAEESHVNNIEAAAEEIALQATLSAPPVLETAEMPSADVEAMQPLDLPELPDADENKGAMATDIERELDAALSGYDRFDSRFETSEPAQKAAGTDARLEFDMGAFEDDLARDLEFVGHDLAARDGDAEYGEDENDREAAAGVDADGRKPKRGMMIAAVVGGVAVLGAIGAFGLTTRDGGETGAPVLVRADTEPVKIVPDDPGGKQVPNQDRAVYGEVDGNGAAEPTQETLVSTSEEPIDLGGEGEPILPSGMTETAKVEDRLAPDMQDATAETPADAAASVLAPRRVRTVIVKPDGTLVEEPVQTEPPAAATASVPEIAPGPVETTPVAEEPVRSVEIAAAPETVETPALARVEEPAPAEAPAQVVETATTEPATAEQVAELASSGAAETPSATETAELAAQPETIVRQPLRAPSAIPERPADQPVNIVGSQQPATRQVAAVPAAPQPQASAPSPVTAEPLAPGTYTVQIASQPSAALAQQSAASLSRQYANVIGGRDVTIQRAEIEGRGTYHRVRIVANGRQDAVTLCEQIKQEGGSCFVAR